MSDFTLEALKRYVVMQLIESTSMQSSREFMSDVNSNAITTAETIKGINDMFTKPGQSTLQTPPPNYQPPQPPPVASPFAPPFAPPQNSIFGQQQAPVQPGFSNAQIVEMITKMHTEFSDMQNQMFNGLQELYNTVYQIGATVKNNSQPKP